MNDFDYAKSVALVTGASRGIGERIALALARRGVRGLVLTARNEGDLARVANAVRALAPGVRVETIAADLGGGARAAAFIKGETDRRGLTVDLLVNNAGFGAYGAFAGSDANRAQEMLAVNIAALTALTREYLPGMTARGWGGVVNVASTAGMQPVPYMAAYGATKAFVLSFSEALWAETRDLPPPADVRVVCLCPGGTETNFAEAAGGMARGKFENSFHESADVVAEAALVALDRNASYAIVGRDNYVSYLSTRVFPRSAVARVAASIFRPQPAAPVAAKPPLKTIALAVAATALAAGAFYVARKRRF